MHIENIRKSPWPVKDAYGFATAKTNLRKLLDPGKNAAPYQQFDSIRKLRTGMRNDIRTVYLVALPRRFSSSRNYCEKIMISFW
jgi:hypothetical protein